MNTGLYPYRTGVRFTPCPVLCPAHFVGERVKRPIDIWKHSSRWVMRYGTVVLRYAMWDRYQADFLKYIANDYPELYAVMWDDGKFEKGFLPHGIMEEQKAVRVC